jgi:hypothetical protein
MRASIGKPLTRMTAGELWFALVGSVGASIIVLIASFPASSLGNRYMIGLCVWVWLVDLLIIYELCNRRDRAARQPHAFSGSPANRVSTPDPELRAWWREMWGLLFGFLITFGAALALLIWFTREQAREEGWWALGTFLRWLPHALLIGLAGGAGAITLLSWIHHRLGIYRCFRCGRPRRANGAFCVCMADDEDVREYLAIEERARVRKRAGFWRHHRRRIVPVLVTYTLLVPVAVAGAIYAPGNPFGSAIAEVAFIHSTLCLLLALGLKLIDAILEAAGRGRRWRLRNAVFVRVLTIWPAIAFVIGFFVIPFG